MEKSILIIEDEPHIRKTVKDYLERDGFTVTEALNGLEGLSLFEAQTPDLIVLDVKLPHKNGWEVLKSIKNSSTVPVIMLTASGDEPSILKGFELKASDYVTKPFSPKILIARIKRILDDNQTAQQTFQYDNLKLIPDTCQLYFDEVEIQLAKKESELLELFMRNPSQVFSRDRILELVWKREYDVTDRVVDAQIKKLRKKLGSYKHMIKTVYGIGYKFSR